MLSNTDLEGFKNWLNKGDKQLQRDPVRPRSAETYISILKNHSECIPDSESETDIAETNKKLLEVNMYQLGVTVKLWCKYKGFKKQTIKNIVSPKQRKQKIKFLTKEELSEIFSNVTKLKDIPYVNDANMLLILLRTMYETGARINEGINIRYKDVSFEIDKMSNGYIIHLYEVTPDVVKRGKARDVMITKKTLDMLIAHMEKNSIERTSDKFIFEFINDENTRAMTVDERLNYRKLIINRMNRITRYVGEKILYKQFTSHTIRHSTFTSMAMDGVDIQLIKNYAGHSSILTTERYIHAAQTMSKKAFAEWQQNKK